MPSLLRTRLTATGATGAVLTPFGAAAVVETATTAHGTVTHDNPHA
ncbi:hypothetical protein [Streptomyces sp. Da 82-17]